MVWLPITVRRTPIQGITKLIRARCSVRQGQPTVRASVKYSFGVAGILREYHGVVILTNAEDKVIRGLGLIHQQMATTMIWLSKEFVTAVDPD
jgi:hypothetical protein